MKNTEPLKIYVAHRYSGDTLETLSNIGRAVETGVEIAKRGHYPFVPHLDCLIAIQSKGCLPLDYYYKSSMAFLQVCDAIYIVDWKDIDTSKGVKAEYEWALANKMPIYYNLDELPKDNETTMKCFRNNKTNCAVKDNEDGSLCHACNYDSQMEKFKKEIKSNG